MPDVALQLQSSPITWRTTVGTGLFVRLYHLAKLMPNIVRFLITSTCSSAISKRDWWTSGLSTNRLFPCAFIGWSVVPVPVTIFCTLLIRNASLTCAVSLPILSIHKLYLFILRLSLWIEFVSQLFSCCHMSQIFWFWDKYNARHHLPETSSTFFPLLPDRVRPPNSELFFGDDSGVVSFSRSLSIRVWCKQLAHTWISYMIIQKFFHRFKWSPLQIEGLRNLDPGNDIRTYSLKILIQVSISSNHWLLVKLRNRIFNGL